MADSLQPIYDALLLDHIRSARHYGLQPDLASVDIRNPMCGDVLQLQLAWSDGDVPAAAVHFECECCGIAMGSASLLTQMLAGAPRRRVAELAGQALQVLRGAPVPAGVGDHLPESHRAEALAGWALLAAIPAQMPARRTCASLGWQAVLAALAGQRECAAEEVRAG